MTGSGPLEGLLPAQRHELLELLLLEEAWRSCAARQHAPRAAAAPQRASTGVRRAPLSDAQRRLWILDRLDPGSSLLNTASAVRLTGNLDLDVLGRSLEEIVRRHHVLRTTFAEGDDGPVQEVGPPFKPELPVVDLSHVSGEAREPDGTLTRVVEQETGRPFDLASGPVLRLCAVRLAPDNHVLVVTAHHIGSDAWSMGVLARELATVYRAFAAGKPSPLVELPLQYADYARDDRSRLGERALHEQLHYWREKLAGVPELLDLAPRRPRPVSRRFRGTTRTRRLSPELSRDARELFRSRNVTLFMGLLAIFEVLLHHRTRETDLVVGVDMANRDRPGTEELIGLFLNQLVLRVDLEGDPTFGGILERVHRVATEAWEHRDVPFDMLVEALRPDRALDRNPLFQVMFGLYNIPPANADLGDLRLESVGLDGRSAMFDLSLYFSEGDKGLLGMLRYDTDLFDAGTVDSLLEDFEHLLGRAVAAPELALSELVEGLEADRRRRRGELRERLRRAGAEALKITRRRSPTRPADPPSDDESDSR